MSKKKSYSIDPSLMRFLIEKTKDAKSPMSRIAVAKEFSETRKKKVNGVSSQKLRRLRFRINEFRLKIHQLDSIDTETKVKMLFALSVPIEKTDFLNELRKDAHVEVDQKNRIIKYKANNGSLELRGVHRD